MNDRTTRGWWISRVFFGALGILAGLDKFTNILVDWSIYLWDFVPNLLNIAPDTYMYIVGIVEVTAGILVFTRYTKYAAYFISAWLVAVAVNLLITGYWDIAVRDIGLSVGAFVLAHLSPEPDVQKRRTKARATA